MDACPLQDVERLQGWPRQRPRSRGRITFTLLCHWTLIGTLIALIVLNWVAVREVARQERPWRAQQAAVAEEKALQAAYQVTCREIVKSARQLLQERTEMYSMVAQFRGMADFAAVRGARLLFDHRFLDHRQCEPTLIFCLPPGQHRLRVAFRECANHAELLQFMIGEFPDRAAAPQWELPGEAVYELRYRPITPDQPTGAGVRLLTLAFPMPQTPEERELAVQDFPTSLPVVGVAEGFGEQRRWAQIGTGSDKWSRKLPLPDGQAASTSEGPGAGHVRIYTSLPGQTFRLARSLAEHSVSGEGPTLGIRWELDSPATASVVGVWDELANRVLQPQSTDAMLVEELMPTEVMMHWQRNLRPGGN